ncbi:noggin-like [Bemisia tabaci]|uniref:noggin-like n=1 Tax=Bemisia tabaci TaxID=7038 RepID=UPI003B285CFF
MRGVGLGSAVGVGGGVAGGGGGAGAGGVGGGRGRAGTGPSPEEYGLRASSLLELDELPIPGLQESPDRALDPRPHELNTTLLRAKLGKNFDPHLMSIFRPKDLYDAAAAAADAEDPDDADYTNEITPSRNRTAAPAPAPGFRRNKHGRLIPLGTMPQFIRDMDFRFVYLPDGTKVKTKISSKLKKKIQQFLWSATGCPVVYRWRDLGSRFWPRWLKEGLCSGSCSIPAGMRCRPSTSARKTLLRFHCRNATPAHRHCHWIKIEYPVISKCACACPGLSYS